MNLLKKLTIRNLKLNKKRTIVTIIGIILSVGLISAVASIYSSALESLIKYEIKENGNFHVSFYDVDKNSLSSLKNTKGISEVFITKDLGYAKLVNSMNLDKPYFFLKGFTQSALENLSVNLVEGRLPENDSEILITTHLKTSGRVEYKVGDRIPLKVGKRVSNGLELTQDTPYDEDNNEKIINTTEKVYTVVGIIERPAYFIEPYSAPGFTIITKVNEEDVTGLVNAYCFIDNEELENRDTLVANILGVDSEIFTKYNTEDYVYDSDEEFEKTINEITKARYQYDYNHYLILLETDPLSSDTIKGLSEGILIVCIIIVLTSVFCIKNSFDISISEKVRQYGMLKSIGATSKQIRKNVFYEATILGLIAIPLGILFGIFATYLLVNISNYLLNYAITSSFKLVTKISWIAIVVSILLGIVTIYASALKSAIKASKVLCIDSIRNSDNIKYKRIKPNDLIHKLFGIGGDISYKNIKRNKKKYRTTVMSLIVSVTIFISLYYFINLFYGEIRKEFKVGTYNISLSATYNNKKSYKNIINTVNLGNIEDYTIYRYTEFTIKNPNRNPMFTYLSGMEDANEEYPIKLITIGKSQYLKFLKAHNLKYDDVKDKAFFFDYNILQDDDGNESFDKNVREYHYEYGETFTGTCSGYGCSNGKIFTLTAGNDFDETITGLDDLTESFILVSDEFFDMNFKSNEVTIYFSSSNADKLQDDIDAAIPEEDYSTYNVNEQYQAMKNLLLLIEIFLYGFIIVITLIGVTNIFNTITTNMELRKQEFATLKSIGMTSKEFNRMIRLESIFIGFKSLSISVILGLLISYGLFTQLASSDEVFTPPFIAIIISMICVYLLITIIMRFSISKINKQNTIETIRNENI